MTGFRSGFVALLGRPNVGKSTLLNALVGQKLAIVSPIAQTTRHRLRGIVTLPEGQLVFVDTPGIHKPHHRLGEILVQNATAAIAAVDLAVWVVDGSVRCGGGDRFVAQAIAGAGTPAVVGVNKADLGTDEGVLASYGAIAREQDWPLWTFSALTGEGIGDLLAACLARLPEGPCYFPPDTLTDRPERFVMGELIREQVLLLTREEVPHSVAVAIDRVVEEPRLTRVLATIVVERMSQKAILIGARGQMLREIGSRARAQMEALVGTKVFLELFVKVVPKWRSSPSRLADLGYVLE